MKLSIDVWLYGAIRSLLINGATGARGAHGPYAYDALGRQTQATDAVGTTAFGYNAYGELETEAIAGLYTKTLTHHIDAYGRDAGYGVNGSRRATIGYDAATGRVATLNEGGVFRWAYLPGSDLKSSLAYPNGLTAEWTYEPSRDLLTSVTNSLPDGTMLSAYAYTNDLLGRRTSKNDEQYGYNVRDELISADERTYAYDDIGNRTTAEGRAYTANSLNQYTAIDEFVPTFDADGNQTKVLTETGEWTVEYNAENRPVRWTQGNKVITMGFDRMGRRVFYKEMEGSRQITHTVFLYNGYLCIQQLFSNSPWNIYKEFIWDPTEPLATRPLCFRQNGQRATFLLHDGNKNVTDVVTVGPHNEPVAHYDYAPFGAITATGTRASHNPFRFSSEFHDDTLALTYYNYRHYNPKDGRWLGRDRLEEIGRYLFVKNATISSVDLLGMLSINQKLYLTYIMGALRGPLGWVWNPDLPNTDSEGYVLISDDEGEFKSHAKFIALGYISGLEQPPQTGEVGKWERCNVDKTTSATISPNNDANSLHKSLGSSSRVHISAAYERKICEDVIFVRDISATVTWYDEMDANSFLEFYKKEIQDNENIKARLIAQWIMEGGADLLGDKMSNASFKFKIEENIFDPGCCTGRERR